MTSQQNQPQYLDAESYSGSSTYGQGFSFKQICLAQLSRITSKASQEWHGGFFQDVSKPMGNGMSMALNIYTPNTRDEYQNATNNLYDLLYPYFDEQMTKESELFWNKRESLIGEFAKNKVPLDTGQNRLVEHHRSLLRSLSSLLKRLGYLDPSSASADE